MGKRQGFNLVESRLWKDPKVRSLDPDARLTWLWLLTNRAANFAGVYDLSVETASKDMGISRQEVAKALKAIEGLRMIRRDADLGAVWIVRRMGIECHSNAQWIGASRLVQPYEGASFYEEIRTLYPTLSLPTGGPSPLPSPLPSPRPSGGHDHDHDHDHDHEQKDMSKTEQPDPEWAFGNPYQDAEKTRLTPAGLAALWNHHAEKLGLSRVRSLSESRKRHAKTALRDEPLCEVWGEVIYQIADDPFLTGKNEHGKTYATFDYLIRPEKRQRWIDLAHEALDREKVRNNGHP